MKKHFKALTLMLALLMVFGLLASCGDTTPEATATPTAAPASEAPAASVAPEATGTVLPIVSEPTTFTAWSPVDSIFPQTGCTTWNDVLCWQEIEKRTGVTIDWKQPSPENASEQFNLMINSGDYTDMIFSSTTQYLGGVDKGVSDNVFLRLNELIDKYAPNYKALRDTNEERAKKSITDNGNIVYFITMMSDYEPPFFGTLVRQDWIDSLGLATPQTLDDWYTMLKAFKDQKNASDPLFFNRMGLDSTIMYAYGVTSSFANTPDFLQVDGKVKYSVLEPGFKEYLTVAKKWYSEGLIAKEFYSQPDGFPDFSFFTTNKSGALAHLHGLIDLIVASSEDKSAQWTAVPYPTLTAGEKLHLGIAPSLVGNSGTAITTNCAQPEIAVKWIDYMYSEEGSQLLNWGLEGTTFTMVDGKPALTDLIMKNPDGLTSNNAIYKYMATSGSPKVYDWNRVYVSTSDVVNAAGPIWMTNNDFAWTMPPVTLTDTEGAEASQIMADINTYVSEKIVKFILGTEPMENYDSFVEQVKSMNIDRAIELRQAALDRYNAR